MTNNTVNETERMTITRVFDAPRELVWKAWTDPKYIMQCGDRRALLRLFARWIFAWEENFSAA
jgi:uncharacterized protein YndB with AHSA1/START domain